MAPAARALAFMATAHCASGNVVTRETECGTFTGTVGEYQAYMQTCAADRFARAVEEARTTRIAAVKEATGIAAQERRAALAENPKRLGEELQRVLDRAPAANRRIAVLRARGTLPQATCDAVSAKIEEVLIRSDRTKLLDRAHIDAVAEELRFSYSGNVDEKTAARLGRFLGATHVLVIAIGPTVNTGIVDITARIIDVERTTIVAVASRPFAP